MEVSLGSQSHLFLGLSFYLVCYDFPITRESDNFSATDFTLTISLFIFTVFYLFSSDLLHHSVIPLCSLSLPYATQLRPPALGKWLYLNFPTYGLHFLSLPPAKGLAQ